MQSSTIPNLHDCTLFALERGLNQGDFTSVQLVEAYLARIAEVDHEFKSVIETNPDAVKIAQALDEERKTLGPQG
jgi:amidase